MNDKQTACGKDAFLFLIHFMTLHETISDPYERIQIWISSVPASIAMHHSHNDTAFVAKYYL